MELKDKAELFKEEAYEAFEKGRYTLVPFFVEQAIQLYIKHILFKKFGDYPKTHNLRILFEELNKILDVKNFIYKNDDIIDLIMTSYIEARYTPMEYSRKSAEKSLKFLEEFLEVIKDEI